MKSHVYLVLLTFVGIILSLDNELKIIKYICVILLLFFLLKKKQYIFKKKYLKINFWLYLFCLSVFASSVNMLFIHFPLDFHKVSPFSGILFIICVIDIFLLLEYLYETKQTNIFCQTLYKTMLLFIVVNDIFLLKQMPSISGMDSYAIQYLIGNKFEVSYFHLFFAALYYQLKCTTRLILPKNKFIFSLHILLCIIVSIFTECSTGIIGTLVLFMSILLYYKISFLFKPQIIILLTLTIGSFFIFYETILNIPFIQYIIVDVLNEDLTLTGSTVIYEKMIDLLYMEPLLGYGNGTATFFTTYYISDLLTNTQNGLLNDFIDWGIIGISCLLLLVYAVFKNNITLNSKYKNPFVCLAFTYIILSSIEITLGLRFLTVLPFCIFYNIKHITGKYPKMAS